MERGSMPMSKNKKILMMLAKGGASQSEIAAADGSYFEAMDGFKTISLLIIDDFMTTPISTQNAIDLFEILEARENKAATVIASQLEPNEWYLRIEGELMADSILSRTAKVARYVDIDGPDMREYFAKKKQAG